MIPPVAAKRPSTRAFHGREFVDDYEWLRDKDNPEVIAHLEAENAYTDAQTSAWSGLVDDVYNEIKSRIKETDMSVPVRQGDWWYYGRTIEGKDYAISCRVPTAGEPWTPPEVTDEMPGEQVLLDVNELAAGHEFFSIGASSVSTSGRLLAYSYDTAGDERFTLRVKDLQTGESLDDVLEGIFYGATWAGEDYLFYVRVDDAWRPYQVWRHALGTDASEDVLVYEEPDEKFGVGVGVDRAERYLFIAASSSLTSEYRVVPLADPTASFEVMWPREAGIEYGVNLAVVGGEEQWVVTHNAHGPNFCVSTVPVGTLPPLRELDVLVEHSDTVRVEGVDTYRDFMFMEYRRGGISRLAVAPLGERFGDFTELAFSEGSTPWGWAATPSGKPRWSASSTPPTPSRRRYWTTSWPPASRRC